MMAYRRDSVCGLFCGACDVFLANREGQVDAAAKAWGMSPDQLVCHGCSSSVHAIYCLDCEIKACASGKNIKHCADCAEAPCERILAFRNDRHAHHSVILANQQQWRALGRSVWLKTQALRWQCPDCGASFAWYDRRCKDCGANLFDCTSEEEQLRSETERETAS